MREGGRTGNPDSCLPSHALLQITAPLVPGPPATRRLELSVFALDHHPQSGMNRSRGVSRGPHSNQLWVSPNQPCDPWAASPQPPLSAPRSPPHVGLWGGDQVPRCPLTGADLPTTDHPPIYPQNLWAARQLVASPLLSTFFHYQPPPGQHFNLI